jgi:hypothetical protein
MTDAEREAKRNEAWVEYARTEYAAHMEYKRICAVASRKRGAALEELVSPEERQSALTARVVAFLVDHCREALNAYWEDADATKLGAAFEKARAEYEHKHKDSDGRP